MGFMRTRGPILAGKLLLLTAVVCWTGLADPLPYLDFRASPQISGSISYGGDGGPLVGTNIGLGSYLAVDTPLNAGGTYGCPGCMLNFSTGGLTDASHGSWVFGDGGNVYLQGTAGTILSGTFSVAAVTPLFGGAYQIAIGGFQAVLDSSLAAAFGLPAGDPYLGAMALQFTSSVGSLPPSGFRSAAIIGGDVAVTPAPVIQAVPEPDGALWQLGLSAAAIVLLTRRFAARQS